MSLWFMMWLLLFLGKHLSVLLVKWWFTGESLSLVTPAVTAGGTQHRESRPCAATCGAAAVETAGFCPGPSHPAMQGNGELVWDFVPRALLVHRAFSLWSVKRTEEGFRALVASCWHVGGIMILKLPECAKSFGESFHLVREQVAVGSFSKRVQGIFCTAKKWGIASYLLLEGLKLQLFLVFTWNSLWEEPLS